MKRLAVLMLAAIVAQGCDRAAPRAQMAPATTAPATTTASIATQPTISELNIELPNDADLNRRVLIRLGVPPTAIHNIDEADGTIGEARALRAIVPQWGIRSVLVVTSKYHTRRAGMTFRWALGDSVRVQTIGSSYDDFQSSRWWQDRSDFHYLIIEYQKLLVFGFESLHRS